MRMPRFSYFSRVRADDYWECCICGRKVIKADVLKRLIEAIEATRVCERCWEEEREQDRR